MRACVVLLVAKADEQVRSENRTASYEGKVDALEREDGRRQTFRIVGEDEADPAEGSVSWISPLGQALLGKRVGDEAVVAGQTVEIVAIG